MAENINMSFVPNKRDTLENRVSAAEDGLSLLTLRTEHCFECIDEEQEKASDNKLKQIEKKLESTQNKDIDLVGKFTNSAKNSEIFNDYSDNSCTGGSYSHVEGYQNSSEGSYNHVEGCKNSTDGYSNHVEGERNTISENGTRIHLEGYINECISGMYCHVGGVQNTLDNSYYCSVFGDRTNAKNSWYAYLEGYGHNSDSSSCHGEGERQMFKSTTCGHAEGLNHTLTGGSYNHAEGAINRITDSHACHASGEENKLQNCKFSAVFGETNVVSDAQNCFVSGYRNYVSGENNLVAGYCCSVSGKYNTVFGKYNTDKDLALCVGNGTDFAVNKRSNALELDWDGNLTIKGKITATNVQSDMDFSALNEAVQSAASAIEQLKAEIESMKQEIAELKGSAEPG